jgi:hypothetical protein
VTLSSKTCGLPQPHVSSYSLRYGGATELAAAGFPQYVISTYGGWTEKSRALHIYTRLSQCTNELVYRAGMHRTVQTVVNDLLMHRQERSKHAQVSSGSDSATNRPTKSRKGGANLVRMGESDSILQLMVVEWISV